MKSENTVRNPKKYIQYLFIAISLLFLGGFNFFSEPDSKYESRECLENPTLQCVHDIVAQYKRDNAKNQPSQTDAAKMQAQQISKYLDECGRYEQRAKYLVGASYGVGELMYLQFLEQAAFKRFKPNDEWYKNINKWQKAAEQLAEPKRSDNFIKIAALQNKIGNSDEALSTLKKVVSPSDIKIRDFWDLRKKFGERASDIFIAYDYVSPLSKAEDLILLGKHDKAEAILLSEYNSVRAKVIPNEVNERSGPLRRISKLFYLMRDKERPLEIADEALEIEKKSQIKSPFIEYEKVSKFYREIAQPDRAKAIMSSYIDGQQKGCGPFSTQYARIECAVELVYLRMPEEAYKRTFPFCRKDRYCSGVIYLYIAAYETGQPTPRIEDLTESVDQDTALHLYNMLAVFHFSRGETDKGNEFLEKAVNLDLDKNINTCEVAHVAYAAGRSDLLDPLFRKSIQFAHLRIKKASDRIGAYRYLLDCYSRP